MNKRQKQVQKQFLDNETQTLDELKKVYNQALESINKNIEDLMARADADTATVVYQLEYQKALKTQINGILDDMNSKQFTTVADYLNQSYEDGFIGTMYDLHGQGVPLLLPIDQEQVVQAVQLDSKISDGLYTAMGENVSKLKKDISSQVSRGIATGMSYQQVAQQISMRMVGTKYKTGGALARSMTIARTEGHRIQCQAGMDALHKAKDKGADVVKQWDSTLDGRTRESHRAVDREIKELNEKFSNGLMFPGDPSGPAAEVCNCRCALLQRARSALKTPFSKWDSQNRELIDFSGEEEYNTFKEKYFNSLKKINASKQSANPPYKTPEKVLSCADFRELSDLFYQKYNISIDSSVKVLDFDSVKEGLSGVAKVLDEFPQAQQSLNRISTKKSGIMCAEYSGTINFNPYYYNTRATAVSASSSSSGFHPKGNNVISTGAHEAGHILEKALIDKSGATIGIIQWTDCTYAKALVKDACKAAKKLPEGKGKLNSQLKNEISGYAKTDDSECVAEAVADYVLNGQNASILSKEIWKILKKELG